MCRRKSYFFYMHIFSADNTYYKVPLIVWTTDKKIGITSEQRCSISRDFSHNKLLYVYMVGEVNDFQDMKICGLNASVFLCFWRDIFDVIKSTLFTIMSFGPKWLNGNHQKLVFSSPFILFIIGHLIIHL